MSKRKMVAVVPILMLTLGLTGTATTEQRVDEVRAGIPLDHDQQVGGLPPGLRFFDPPGDAGNIRKDVAQNAVQVTTIARVWPDAGADASLLATTQRLYRRSGTL